MAATAVDQKLLRQTKFPIEFNQKVDMRKVNVEVMKKWIAGKISEILGSEDDIVTELCFNLLEGARFPDIKSLQIQLTGFLDKDTARFCKELWNLCLSAQSNAQGVPKELLEAKKLELLQEKIDAEKAASLAKQRHEQDTNREQDINTIRHRERRERAERGRGRGGFRNGRNFDTPRAQGSRSPPPKRTRSPHRDYPPRRDADSWVPSGRGRRRGLERGRSRTRSTTRSSSGSRSPPPRPRRRSPLSSRSRSPPRRKHGRSYSVSRSRSPPFRNGRGERKRPGHHSDRHRRPSSHSDASYSRSPRRRHRSPRENRNQTHQSRSLSQQRTRQHRSRSHSQTSPPNSKSRDESRNRKQRKRRLSSPTSVQTSKEADIVRTHPSRDDRRLSRSPDTKPRRRRYSSSRSRSRDAYRPRRRSLQRWEPSARRRKNTSSPSGSSPETKRPRRASTRESLSPDHDKVSKTTATEDVNAITE